jgi:hypothetical protein
LRAGAIRNGIAVAALVALALLLALRFDLLQLLLADPPVGTTLEHAGVPDRAAAATAGSARRAEPRQVEARAPSSTFDVVRIASDGVAVFAGRAPAESIVTISANAEHVATVQADANGAWAVIIDRRFVINCR